MVNFNFATAQRILFGSGRLSELGALAAQYGRRVALVTGGGSLDAKGALARIEAMFGESALPFLRVKVTREPTVEAVDEAVAEARGFKADVIVAIGGGSVLDTGKALAALLANGGLTLDYLEEVGRGAQFSRPSLPCIAVPTTAGTGSEATKNSVISNAAHSFKRSLRSDWLLPAAALVDPELTAGCPRMVAAACGMDALTQLVEAFTSRRANPVVDALAGVGLGMSARLPALLEGPPDATTREALALASLLSGIALANAGLGAVHGLAAPLGAFFPVPHGVVCAALLGPVVAANARRAAAEDNALLLTKYAAAAMQLLGTGHEEGVPAIPFEGAPPPPGQKGNKGLEVALSLAGYLNALRGRLGLPGLGNYGLTPAAFPRIIAEARSSSMKTNPVTLEEEDLAQVLMEAL